jgi:hypothetical protein
MINEHFIGSNKIDYSKKIPSITVLKEVVRIATLGNFEAFFGKQQRQMATK